MKKKLIGIISTAVVFASGAYAFTNGGGQSGSAPGQINAVGNCVDTIIRQNANGVTGAKNGNDNDNKQLDTAVANCDHFWTLIG